MRLHVLIAALCMAASAVRAVPESRGMVYVGWNSGAYSTPDSDLSLKLLAQTQANTVSIVIGWFQPNVNSVKIAPVNGSSPSDADVIHAITTAHSLGLKVCLKPHVDLTQDASHWRGQIGMNFGSAQWAQWFTSYNNDFIIPHVVKLAAAHNVEMINIGTELSVAQTQEQQWRSLVSQIRGLYKGTLVYGSNWDTYTQVAWFDAIDYIGVDAYFILTNHASPTVAELDAAWQPIVAGLQKVSQKFNKKVMFLEIGYTSSTMAAMQGGGPLSLVDQANAYQAFFDSVYDQPWFAGVHFWAWNTDSRDGGRCDDGFSPHNKPAQTIVKKYYSQKTVLDLDDFALRTAASLVVYADGAFGAGWASWSYGGTVNPQAKDQVYPGSTFSMSADMNAWGAVSLHVASLNIASYTAIQFVAYGSASQNNHLNVAFTSASGAVLQATQIANYLPNCILQPTWVKVTIPLSDMAIGDGTISRVNINNGQTSEFKFWVDQIMFI